MQAVAHAKYTRISAKKAVIVADLVRGMNITEALNTLQFTPKKAARILHKLVRSAASNAISQMGATKLSDEDLVIKEIRVNGGPMMKRNQPRARGRAFLIRKRMSHITVVVETK
ncbi:TPA: 50S ribosomal protein L22 [candidate division WOR-3 bacterium]|jgi:large subunit ribosomal protein L22|uniref:Large ribosomal subunit protein uL22 n=1 Tax=candidate division WOR-3 bacterium TaxID=2052148 RepID=A0A350HBZ6_UNCW3|nr:50S ribosomal protein L22 [candidate division WOR-3 bacterium]